MTAKPDKSEPAISLAQSIAALPPLPATAQKILTCFGDEFIDADKVTEVVEGDPGICAKLLGLSNSAYFGLAEPVHSISEAISRVLGVDTVRSLVLAMAIQRSFNNKGCPSFQTERFWLRSLLVAECCKKMALADEASDDSIRDLAYSAGLCHNLGLMALVHLEPLRTDLALKSHGDQGKRNSLSEMLLKEFAVDHKIMSAELARSWSLPAPMLAAYEFRAYSGSQCDERLGMIVVAGIIAVENSEVGDGLQSDLGDYAELLGLNADDLQEMAQLSERQKDRIQTLVGNMSRR